MVETRAGSPALPRPAARRSCRPRALRRRARRASLGRTDRLAVDRPAAWPAAARPAARQRRPILRCCRLPEQRRDLLEVDRLESAAPAAAGRPRPARPRTAAGAPARAASSLRDVRFACYDSASANVTTPTVVHAPSLKNPASHPGVRQQAQQRKQHEHRAIGEDRRPDVSRPACHGSLVGLSHIYTGIAGHGERQLADTAEPQAESS